jgi:aspartate/methionine/tyrosine aminotransferase
MPSDELFKYPTLERMKNSLNRKWQIHPKDVIPMYLASPDFPILDEIKQVLHKAVEDGDLYYNSDLKPRIAMAEKIKRVNRIEVKPEQVMISQGVEPILWYAVKHACRKGDEVVLPNPMYSGFLHAVNEVNAKPVYWDLDFEEGYPFDLENLKEIVTKKTKLICLCNPHNPAGRVMTKDELKGVADLAVDYDVKVFVDELWEDIRFDERKHVSIASLNPEIENLTSTAWGVSKTFGVAGLYLGYVASTNDEMLTDFKKAARPAQRGASTLARAAAPIMLDRSLDWWRRDLMIHLTKIRDLCVKRMNDIPNVRFPKIEGTYMAFPRFDLGMTSMEIYNYLIDEVKVALSLGTNFGSKGEHHMRMCLATSEVIANEAIDRIEAALNKI